MSERDLTELQAAIMQLLIRPRTGKEVAERYKAQNEGREIPYGTLYTLIRRLRAREYVTIDRRETSKQSDRRYRVFKLTGAGVAALNRVPRASSADGATDAAEHTTG
ncbi:MAG: helix-turn-helix transcriptional regulator [Planctomycetota bacterium]